MEHGIDNIILGALKEAGLLHQTYLGSEHLLLAILKDEKLAITQLLNGYGMSYYKVRLDLLELNYCYGLVSERSGYSKSVEKIMKECHSSDSILTTMMKQKDSLACCLLERYSIPIEKVIN